MTATTGRMTAGTMVLTLLWEWGTMPVTAVDVDAEG